MNHGVIARDESGGMIDSVTDAEIIAAYRLLAKAEGVFCEPASAAAVAGLLKCGRQKVPLHGKIVCVLTGHGLKDPQTPMKFRYRRRVFRLGVKASPLDPLRER
ncbi:MAG: pyridoxal-phosphate dependent enzyme [Elusimicrobia bacterium]|nr:pyridoxal-phosphate dependent enzyme [Elusimicrobiota bacterium]